MKNRKFKVDDARRLELLVERLGISQAELARISGVGQSDISYYLSGRKEPGKLACLLFAGLSASADQRAYWTSRAELTSSQRRLLAAALEVETESASLEHQELIAMFLEFWERPQTRVQHALRELLRETLTGMPEPKEL